MSYAEDDVEWLSSLPRGIERYGTRHLESFYPSFFYNDKTWTTKDGQMLELSQMSRSHQLNTVAMLKRKFGPGARRTPLIRELEKLIND